MEEVIILSCGVPNNNRLTCTAEVIVDEGRSIVLSLQVDTGASVSVLSLPYVKAHFKGSGVYPTDTKFYGVGHHPLPVVGKLPATEKDGSHSASAHFYVVDTPTNEVLPGLDALCSLGLTIESVSGKIGSAAPAEKTFELPAIVGIQTSHQAQT